MQILRQNPCRLRKLMGSQTERYVSVSLVLYPWRAAPLCMSDITVLGDLVVLTMQRRRTEAGTWRGVSRQGNLWKATLQIGGQDFFLGRAFRSAEAAARAVDRATIAVLGRDSIDTNFPMSVYPPQVR